VRVCMHARFQEHEVCLRVLRPAEQSDPHTASIAHIEYQYFASVLSDY